MKKRSKKGKKPPEAVLVKGIPPKPVLNLNRFTDKEQAEDAVALLNAAGIKAGTDARDFGSGVYYAGKATAIYVWYEDGRKAREILERARLFARPRKSVQIPPEEGMPEFLDMLIHDCRQYLMIATGELKNIEEEGELDLDDPTNDLFKIGIRLKRLKDQCMQQAGYRPLDWEHGGGLGKI